VNSAVILPDHGDGVAQIFEQVGAYEASPTRTWPASASQKRKRQAGERTLPGSARADHRDPSPGSARKTDVVEHGTFRRVVREADVLETQRRVGRHDRRPFRNRGIVGSAPATSSKRRPAERLRRA